MSTAPKHKSLVYLIAAIAALAGLLFGIDIGLISGALDYIQQEFQLSTFQEEMVTGAILLGAAVGAVFSGWFCHRYGRHRALLLSAFIFTLGSLGSAFAPSADFLIGVRFILGLALGMASYSAPLYIAEMAPADIRGRLITGYQLMITLGIVLAFVSDTIFVTLAQKGLMDASIAWRWMLGILALPSAFMFVVVLFLPGSPRWAVLKGFDDEARNILLKLRYEEQVESEYQEIKASLSWSAPVRDLLKNKNFIRVVALGIGLQIIQQLSGMNAILYYAPQIFKTANLGLDTGMWATVSIGIVNVLSTIIALYLVESLGRRKLLYTGAVLLFLSTLLLGFLFKTSMVNQMPWFSVAIVFVFIFGFAISYGPVIWILCSEIYPLSGRDFGVACSTTANWIGNVIIGTTSLSIMRSLGTSTLFYILAAIAGLSFLFFYRFVPETKGISLEHIEKKVWQGKPLKEIGA